MNFGEDDFSDLEQVFPGRMNEGKTLLYQLAQLRYFTIEQFTKINRSGTKPKFQKLQELGYIEDYTLSKKASSFLKKNGFNTWGLTERLRGGEEGHGFAISKVVQKLMQRPDYFFVFYKTFKHPPDYQKEFVRPDFCMVFKKENKGKLIFGEVEGEKTNWETYLKNKKADYEAVARDPNTHSQWWKTVCRYKGLQFCDQGEFGFSVHVFGNVNYDWEGWEFIL